MHFQFPPAIQAGIKAGKYSQVLSASGIPLSMVRDSSTGQFVGHAVGLLNNNGVAFNPVVTPLNLATSGLQMHQMHRGFQAVEASLGVLQATTAVIGVGVVASVALSVVNLYQTIKIRKAVERLELRVENGFIDLKRVFINQGSEIINHIDQVAQDMKFEQHRLILVRAYGQLMAAIKRFNSAIKLKNIQTRNTEINAVRGILFESLADYQNPQLLEENSACGLLRRCECSWLIEQMIIATYQIQNELIVASERLCNLDQQIKNDCVQVLEKCDSGDELDFLFPEITRLHDQDLIVLESWRNNLNYMQSLSKAELQLLQSSEVSQSQLIVDTDNLDNDIIEEPELKIYETLQEKSHFNSLVSQLIFMMKPKLRKEYEDYINDEAKKYNYKVFIPSNLKEVSNFTLANLFWYFLSLDDSDNEESEMVDSQLESIEDENSDDKLEQSKIFLQLKMVIVEQLDVDYNDVNLHSNFSCDLDADSLDAVELIMALEEAFEINIPDKDAEKNTNC